MVASANTCTVADVSDGDVIGDLPYLIIAKSLDYTYYKALGYVIEIYTTISSGPVQFYFTPRYIALSSSIFSLTPSANRNHNDSTKVGC